MFVLCLLLGLLPAALAASNAADCLDCCKASGLSGCSTELYVVGEASKVFKEGSGWRASGLYIVSCDGRGFFDDGRTTVFSSLPTAGDVAKSSSAQWDCFAKTCQLPTNLCFDSGGGHVSMCDTGQGPTAAAFRAAPGPRPGVASSVPTAPASTASSLTASSATPTVGSGVTVMIDGRALSVEVAGPQSAPAGTASSTSSTPSTPSASPPPAVAGKPKGTGTILFDDLDDEEILAGMRRELDPSSAPAKEYQRPEDGGGVVGGVVGPVLKPGGSWTPSATSTYTPSSTPSPGLPSAVNTPPPGSSAVKLDAVALLTQGLPRDPPAECEAPMEALRGEARKQVMAGDDLRLGKDAAGAIQKYRAALSMDACNGYAWLGLGESAVAIDRPDIAIRALRNATTLLPQHYGAWTELGQSYEAIRQLDLAVAAYKKAVALKAGLEIPLAGLQRLGQ